MRGRGHSWIFPTCSFCRIFVAGTCVAILAACGIARAGDVEASASSSQAQSSPAGALDRDRFGVGPAQIWRGNESERTWWWQCRWDEPRNVGAILQIVGDDPQLFQNAPRSFVWQASLDGRTWSDLDETAVRHERRMFRLHRLKSPRRLRFLRLRIDEAEGRYPTLREIEVFAQPETKVDFPDWIAVVSTLDRGEWDRNKNEGRTFVPLARGCPGWDGLEAQYLWLGRFDESFVSAEPRPLCAFLSGNFSDFCQKDREAWRGTEEILKNGHLPIWASCGGAQGLAILADTGVDKPWDCPHCRDPLRPKSPIYGHIGHTGAGPHKCGDYSGCLFERGKQRVLTIADDPVFAGLPREFEIMESHCGQIEYAPRGWTQVVTKGAGAKTSFQCLRVHDRYIYAAQFHIEMAGAPENSRQIMANFLGVAKAWGGYNSQGTPPAPPTPLQKP